MDWTDAHDVAPLAFVPLGREGHLFAAEGARANTQVREWLLDKVP